MNVFRFAQSIGRRPPRAQYAAAPALALGSALALVLGLAPATPSIAASAHVSDLSDSFAENAINTNLWSVGLPAGDQAPLYVADVNQHLQISPYANVSYSAYSGVYSTNTYSLTNSEVYTQVTRVATGDAADTSLVAYVDPLNRISITVEGSVIYFQKMVGGTVITHGWTGYVPSVEAWWRIRDASGIIYWETSADGNNWVIQAQAAEPFAVSNVRVVLTAGTWASNPSPAQAFFSNVNVAPGGSVPAPPQATAMPTRTPPTSTPTAVPTSVPPTPTSPPSSGVPGNAVYVSPNGSNGNPGTAGAPWRSLQKAVDSAAPGSTIVLYGGVYNQEMILTRSGAAGSPVTIMGYPGQTAVIDPSVQVTNWTQVPGTNVWSAPFTPGAGFCSPLGCDAPSPMTSAPSSNLLSLEPDGFVSVDRVPDQAHWLSAAAVSDPSTIGAGQWSRVTGGNLYVHLSDNSSPNNHQMFAANGQRSILIWQTSYLTLKNLTLRMDGLSAIEAWGGSEHDVTLDGLDVSLTHTEAVRTQWGNTAWTIQNNNFHHTGSEASLHLQASNSTVQNNSFGPMLTTVTVNGNYGLDILGNHNEVRGNTFFGHRDNGIILEQWYCSTSSACNDTAQYNTIENNRFFSEPGGIDVYGADNNVFKNNLFYNSANAVAFIQGGRAGANPSYSEQQPTNNLFANNTAYNISSIAVYFDSSAAGNVIQNNIFSSAKLAFWNPSNNSRNPISTNLYDNTGVYTMDSNPLTGSAQFVNAGAQNFYLQSGSAAIDRGLTISQVPVDMVGTARPKGAAYDIGAYEFVH